GLALGVLYAWVLSPLQVMDSAPEALRADFKDQYRAVIAAAYAANSDLTRAQSRLALLGDTDSYAALSAQAQRMLSSGDALQSFQLAQLASALQGDAPTAISSTPTRFVAQAFTSIAETTTPPIFPNTSTPFDTGTFLPEYTATPRATRTPIPPPGAPFELLEQETVCDESLAEGLLQVIAITANRRNLPGIELILSWAGGEEHFFTGFKPELGNGYADAILLPNISYTLRAAQGGTLLAGLVAPACQKINGEAYFGSLKITLYRP
ncbi:MAG TPA: hypothetical protein VLM78_04830, partial [Anaerolineales bacterium]|nr:hypothetical protein [Anaerolineales bacterium]